MFTQTQNSREREIVLPPTPKTTDSFVHGYMDAWIHRSMDSWTHGPWTHECMETMDSWFQGAMDAWIHGSMDS